MDVSPFLAMKCAPRAVFDALAERRDRARFMLPKANGGWDPVTWEDFAGQIRRAALYLSACGFGPGNRAVVFAPNRVEWMSAALAIQSAGGVLVPLYPASTADQAAYVLRHSDARVAFVDGAAQLSRILERWRDLELERVVLLDESLDAAVLLEGLRSRGLAVPSASEVGSRLVTWSQALSIGEACERKAPAAFDRMLDAVGLDQPGLMLYTSGTSGNPKGVPLTHRNVAANGSDWLTCNAPLLEEAATDLLWLPMSHIFGFGEACLGNTLGFTTYMADSSTVLQRLPEVRPDVFMSVPAYWEKLAMAAASSPDPKARRETLQSITGGRLRFCLSGGAGLKEDVKRAFHEAGILIIEGYGLTETAPTLTLNRPDAFRFDSVGKPLPSVEIRLAGDGEILARGPNVFSGYHKDPAATKEAFTADGWFKTGDVGRFTADGFLQIIDRKKDILVTAGGKNVPPANIELQFRDDPFIEHVVIYGDGKKYLVAGVWARESAVEAHVKDASAEARAALIQQRIDRVNAGLAGFETIKRFHLMDVPLTVENGLLTASLKVRRKKIYERFAPEFEGLYGSANPARSLPPTLSPEARREDVRAESRALPGRSE